VKTLSGELDIADAADVTAALAAAAAGRTGVVADLAGLTFIDCSGVAALARAQAKVRQAGSVLLLAAPSRRVLRAIALTGMVEIAGICASIEDALDVAAARPHGHAAVGAQAQRGPRNSVMAGGPRMRA
jgi:anti-sigma B factor antagonist